MQDHAELLRKRREADRRRRRVAMGLPLDAVLVTEPCKSQEERRERKRNRDRRAKAKQMGITLEEYLIHLDAWRAQKLAPKAVAKRTRKRKDAEATTTKVWKKKKPGAVWMRAFYGW
jgi:hypothetical protein